MELAYEYKFSNGKRLPCPRCGSSRSFAPIKGYEHKPEYGYCHACGDVHFPNQERRFITQEDNVVQMPEQTKTIDKETMEATFKKYDKNPFALWLIEMMGRAAAEDALFYWRIGTAKAGGTVFWFVDAAGRIRQPKIVYYGLNGKRLKDRLPIVPEAYVGAKGYSQCLWGEFQLHGMPEAHVYCVESEKTAIIGKHLKPQYAWIATGGANGLTAKKATALRNRNVLLLPDADKTGKDTARKNMELLKSDFNCNVAIHTLFRGRNDGYDLADWFADEHARKYDWQTTDEHADNYMPF